MHIENEKMFRETKKMRIDQRPNQLQLRGTGFEGRNDYRYC